MYLDATLRPIGQFLSRSWLGLAYGAILISTYFVTTSLSEAQWDSLSQTISTNMSNMEHHPVMVLIASALVADGSIVLWTTMTVVLLIVLQRWIGFGGRLGKAAAQAQRHGQIQQTALALHHRGHPQNAHRGLRQGFNPAQYP